MIDGSALQNYINSTLVLNTFIFSKIVIIWAFTAKKCAKKGGGYLCIEYCIMTTFQAVKKKRIAAFINNKDDMIGGIINVCYVDNHLLSSIFTFSHQSCIVKAN